MSDEGNQLTVTVDDTAFQIDFKRALGELEERAKKDVRTRAERVLARAQELVHVDSGETRDSGEVRFNDDGSADVVFTAHQAIFEEFGTSNRAATPFIRPAMAEEK